MPENVVDLLSDLVAIPSVNPMGRDLSGPIYFEANVTEYLRQFFIELGCSHEVIEVSPGRCKDCVLKRTDVDKPHSNSEKNRP